MSRKQKQKRKQEPSTRPKQAATSPSQPASKSRWLRSDIIIAMISLIIAITAILISLTIPEVRRFLGFDRPDQLRTLYTGNLSPSNGAPSNAQQSTAMISLFFDWESPEGDIAGTITTITTTQTQCSFRGTVTTDHHLRLTCRNPDLSFDGYIYADGHIKGTLSSSSGVTTWNLNRASADIPPAQPPSTPISSTPTQNVMTPTPVLLNLSQITIYNNPMSDVDSVAWSPDGKWLAFADLETVQVWDAHTGKLLLTYRGHSN